MRAAQSLPFLTSHLLITSLSIHSKVILADVRANLKKIDQGPHRTSGMELLRPLLELEVGKKIHPKNALRLADKSAGEQSRNPRLN